MKIKFDKDIKANFYNGLLKRHSILDIIEDKYSNAIDVLNALDRGIWRNVWLPVAYFYLIGVQRRLR